ncbi:hypothetical protein ACJJTC_009173 [Scirpophaga incertulas]
MRNSTATASLQPSPNASTETLPPFIALATCEFRVRKKSGKPGQTGEGSERHVENVMENSHIIEHDCPVRYRIFANYECLIDQATFGTDQNCGVRCISEPHMVLVIRNNKIYLNTTDCRRLINILSNCSDNFPVCDDDPVPVAGPHLTGAGGSERNLSCHYHYFCYN